MASRPPARSPIAGGILFAVGAIAGSVIGLFRGQPTIGFLTGIGIAAAISLLLWWRDQRSA